MAEIDPKQFKNDTSLPDIPQPQFVPPTLEAYLAIHQKSMIDKHNSFIWAGSETLPESYARIAELLGMTPEHLHDILIGKIQRSESAKEQLAQMERLGLRSMSLDELP